MSMASSVWIEMNEDNFRKLKMGSFEKAEVKHLKFEILFPSEIITKLNMQPHFLTWTNENILMSPILPRVSEKRKINETK